MTELFDYVGHNLLTDGAASLNGEHGLVDMQTIEAIHEAAATDERVPIDGSR
jgi:xylose dehydrogenase (NAD/NADP)